MSEILLVIMYFNDVKNYRLNVDEFIFFYINVTIRQCLRIYHYSLYYISMM